MPEFCHQQQWDAVVLVLVFSCYWKIKYFAFLNDCFYSLLKPKMTQGGLLCQNTKSTIYRHHLDSKVYIFSVPIAIAAHTGSHVSLSLATGKAPAFKCIVSLPSSFPTIFHFRWRGKCIESYQDLVSFDGLLLATSASAVQSLTSNMWRAASKEACDVINSQLIVLNMNTTNLSDTENISQYVSMS